MAKLSGRTSSAAPYMELDPLALVTVAVKGPFCTSSSPQPGEEFAVLFLLLPINVKV